MAGEALATPMRSMHHRRLGIAAQQRSECAAFTPAPSLPHPFPPPCVRLQQNVQAMAAQQMLQHSLAAMQGPPAGVLAAMGIGGYAYEHQAGQVQGQPAAAAGGGAAAPMGPQQAGALAAPLPLKVGEVGGGAAAPPSSGLASLANLAAAGLADLAAAAAGSGAAGTGGSSSSSPPLPAAGAGAVAGPGPRPVPGIQGVPLAASLDLAAPPVQPTWAGEHANGSRAVAAAAPSLPGPGNTAAPAFGTGADGDANGTAHSHHLGPRAAAAADGAAGKPTPAAVIWATAPGTPPE